MQIYIEDESNTEFDIEDRDGTIKAAVAAVAKEKNVPDLLEVNVLITDAASIREINYEARGIDSATDVLSFPYFEYASPGVFPKEADLPSGECILGDIILCAEKIIAQAEEYGHSQKRELAFLTVHSMLHLLGYDHMEEQDALLMRAEEKNMMELLDIPR